MAMTLYYSSQGELLGESTDSVAATYMTDALGSTIGTFQGGAVVNSYAYSPYGLLTSKTGTGADPEFLWNGWSGYRTTGRAWSDTYARRRHYGSTESQWTTQARLQEQLAGEHPYAYAGCNPVTLTDPTGLTPACQQQGDPTLGWIQGMNRAVQNWFDSWLRPPPFEPYPCPPGSPEEESCKKICADHHQPYKGCTVESPGVFGGSGDVLCDCLGCPPYANLPFCSAATPGHIIRHGHGNHNFPLPIGPLKHTCLDNIVNTQGVPIPRGGGAVGQDPCKYTGHCFGKTVIVTVGYGAKGPCISDAYFAK